MTRCAHWRLHQRRTGGFAARATRHPGSRHISHISHINHHTKHISTRGRGHREGGSAMGKGRKRARGYTLQRGRRGLAGVGVGVGRAVLKLPFTKFLHNQLRCTRRGLILVVGNVASKRLRLFVTVDHCLSSCRPVTVTVNPARTAWHEANCRSYCHRWPEPHPTRWLCSRRAS